MLSSSGIKCLVLGVSAVLAGPALAATSASAGVSGLVFELVDLAPGDGLGTSMRWTSQSAFSQTDRVAGQSFEFSPQSDGSVVWSVAHATVESGSDDQPSRFASLSRQGDWPRDGVLASTDATSLGTGGHTRDGGEKFNASAYQIGGFSLSAHTELRVTGMANVSISGSGSEHTLLPTGMGVPAELLFSQANTYLSVFLGESSYVAMLDGKSYVPSSDPTRFSSADYADATSTAFSLSLRNDTAQAMDSWFSVIGQSSLSQLAVSPVPEPGSAWMLGLGALVLGASARRKPRGR